MACTPQKELQWDEFMCVDGDACVGSDWAAPCTILLAQGTESRPAYLGHFLSITSDGMINQQILNLLLEARRAFGGQLRLKIRGNAYFPHIGGEHLREMQLSQRSMLERVLDSLGIPSDIEWAQDNILTSITFDARTGEDRIERRSYVPRTTQTQER